MPVVFSHFLVVPFSNRRKKKTLRQKCKVSWVWHRNMCAIIFIS